MNVLLLSCALLGLPTEPAAANAWFVAVQATLETQYPSGRMSCTTVEEMPGFKQSCDIHSLEWKDGRTACDYTYQQVFTSPEIPKENVVTPQRIFLLRLPDKTVAHVEPDGLLLTATDLKTATRYPAGVCVRPDELWFRASGPLGPRWSVWQSLKTFPPEKFDTTVRTEKDRIFLKRKYIAGIAMHQFEIDAGTGCILSYHLGSDGSTAGARGRYEWAKDEAGRPRLLSCEMADGGEVPSRRFTYTLKSFDANYIPPDSRFDPAQIKLKPGTEMRLHTPQGTSSSRFGKPPRPENTIPFDKLINELRSNGFASPSREQRIP